MINAILTGILTTALFVSPVTSTPKPVKQDAVKHVALVRGLVDSEYAGHIVQPGEYLSSIAKDYYGNEDYWSNIWNDNQWIEDAATLEMNWVIKVRREKTVKPEELDSTLVARIEEKSKLAENDETLEGSTGIVQSIAVTAPSVTPAPIAVQQPVAVQAQSAVPSSLNEAQINYLGSCEAGMDPTKNTGNGYYGAFQFSPATWNSMGTGYARADLAPLDVQKAAVQRLLARSSIYTQFPGCAKKMHANGLI